MKNLSVNEKGITPEEIKSAFDNAIYIKDGTYSIVYVEADQPKKD